MNAWRPDIDQAPTLKWPRMAIDLETDPDIDQVPTSPLSAIPSHAPPTDATIVLRQVAPRAATGSGRARSSTRLTRLVDRLSGGRAVLIGRLATYLLFGGTAAVINLVVFAVVLRLPLPIPDFARNLVAFAVAAEVATVANFIPNDQITFRHLPGYSRVWWQRCLRFHATCAAGTALTYAIQAGLHYGMGVSALVSEAIALVVVTAFNFTTHHLFTYARTRGIAHHP